MCIRDRSFKLRQLEDMLPRADKADIITVFLALQRQSFVLGNNISQLIKSWPSHHPAITPEDLLRFGISSEIKD